MELSVKYKSNTLKVSLPLDATIGAFKDVLQKATTIDPDVQKLMIKGARKFTDQDRIKDVVKDPTKAQIMLIGTPSEVKKKIEETHEIDTILQINEEIERQTKEEEDAKRQSLFQAQQELERERRASAQAQFNQIRAEPVWQPDVQENPDDPFEVDLPLFSPGFASKTSVSNYTNMISLPPKILEMIVQKKSLHSPLSFELSFGDKKTHVGVLDFTAPTDTAYVPFSVIENLGVEEGQDRVSMKIVQLPQATRARLQPYSLQWLQIDPLESKPFLESKLRLYQCLTVGDKILINRNNVEYPFRIIELEPDSACSIIDCDLNVDIDPPIESFTYEHQVLEYDHEITHQLFLNKNIFFSVDITSPYSRPLITFQIISGNPKCFMSFYNKFPNEITNVWDLQRPENINPPSSNPGPSGPRDLTRSRVIDATDKDFHVGLLYIGVIGDEDGDSIFSLKIENLYFDETLQPAKKCS